MSSGSMHIGNPRLATITARLLSSAVTLLLLPPSLVAREPSPAVKLAVAPKYPALTLAGRVFGQVTVRVTLDRSGNVLDASVIEGHPMLRDAALYAARQWKFAASPVAVRVTTLRFKFVVLPDTAPASSQVIFLPPNGFEIRQKPPSPDAQDGGSDAAPVSNPISAT